MNSHPISRRVTSALLLATLGVGTLAPAAHAGHGNGQYYKYRRGDGDDCGARSRVVVVPENRVIVRERTSGGGGVLAGLIGGIAIGALLSNASHAHAAAPPAADECRGPEVSGGAGAPDRDYGADDSYTPPDTDYSFDDPYCHERFSSLALYRAHVERHGHHALVAQVIDNRDGDVIDVVRFTGGHWESCDASNGGDRDDRGYDEGDGD